MMASKLADKARTEKYCKNLERMTVQSLHVDLSPKFYQYCCHYTSVEIIRGYEMFIYPGDKDTVRSEQYDCACGR